MVAALQRQPLWGWLAPLLLQLIVLRMINRSLVGKSVSIAAAGVGVSMPAALLCCDGEGMGSSRH